MSIVVSLISELMVAVAFIVYQPELEKDLLALMFFEFEAVFRDTLSTNNSRSASVVDSASMVILSKVSII